MSRIAGFSSARVGNLCFQKRVDKLLCVFIWLHFKLFLNSWKQYLLGVILTLHLYLGHDTLKSVVTGNSYTKAAQTQADISRREPGLQERPLIDKIPICEQVVNFFRCHVIHIKDTLKAHKETPLQCSFTLEGISWDMHLFNKEGTSNRLANVFIMIAFILTASRGR